MKFLFVSPEALSVDLAYRIHQENNEVKFFIQSETEKDVGDGFVEKVSAWDNLIEWADVIVFDDIGFGRVADKLRAEGKRVVGGSSYTDRLENEREFGQQELAKAGVSVLPNWNFSDFGEAIKFVQANPQRYVIKPSGKAQNEKELLFVGQEEDGNDVIDVLAHYKKNWSNKIRIFQIQKYASGVEVGVGAFFNGKEFVMPININFEHKRLFPGEIGPSTGEMGCYDDATEVLTEGGWKLFKDLNYNDKICTLNPENHSIEYHEPETLVCFGHHKKLKVIKNECIDLAVTLDHNMYVCQPNQSGVREPYSFVKAKYLQSGSKIKTSGEWIGKRDESISASVHNSDRHLAQEMQISMDDWLAFVGVWFGRGSISEETVSLSVPAPGCPEQIQSILTKLPYHFKLVGQQVLCGSAQLHSILSDYFVDGQKSIPQDLKMLNASQLQTLLKWFALDQRSESRVFRTTSKRLADDIQELLLKIGRSGVIRELQVSRGCTEYEVAELGLGESMVESNNFTTVDYCGLVYCATVKNHLMYVRRNGKACWCGNTSMLWSQTNKIFDLTLAKIKDRLVEAKYCGYIDINCIANSKTIYPLEFTSRFGYPTISIQMEGVTSDWGKFLYSMANADVTELKTKKGFQIGVVVAVPPFPFNDERTFKKYSEDAAILFKKNNADGVHLGEVKKVENDWRVAGRSGYCLVVTGSASTMEDARNQAYNRVSNIMIPNMFYRTDIGKRWTRDSDLLQSSGFL